MLIFDAHLDLSMNALEWNRDLRLDISEIRERENGMQDKPDRGLSTVSFPELKKGNIRICVATLIARYVAKDNPLPGWHSQQQAWAQTQGQLAWYKSMEKEGFLVPITNLAQLQTALANDDPNSPLAYILSLEGADSIVDMSYLEEAYQRGLRAVGPAHYGPGVYAFGTNSTGGIGIKGKELLEKMEALNMILDVTHLCDQSFWEALDVFKGNIWASHSNCRALVNHNRQFDDDQIKELIARGAVIGGALDAWMMTPNWERGKSTPKDMGVSLDTLIDHMDHICQIAGNANHIGLGTDLDGGFGKEQSPHDLETIADLQKLNTLLLNRGYSADDLKNIFHLNWINFLERAWA